MTQRLVEEEIPQLKGSWRRASILALLAIIYALNFLDRQILIILQEPIKQEFNLADWQLGLVTGGVVSVFYTLVGLPLAHWIDRGLSRVRLISVATGVWSAMTLICGVCQNFTQLLLARVGVGIAESGFVPAAHSLISDYYPAKDRPRAMGVFSLGLPLGMMAGLIIGGAVAEATNWRTALLVAGAPGVFLALFFIWFAPEPRRTKSAPGFDKGVDASHFLRGLDILRRRPAFVYLVAAMTVCTFVQAGINAWLPSLLMRLHGLSISQVGTFMGIAFGVGGALGTFLGGWQASRWSPSAQHKILLAPAIAVAGCLPCYALAFLSNNPIAALGLLALPFVLGSLWVAPSVALIQSLAPSSLRARASALSAMTANLIGMSSGPVVVGFMSDAFASSKSLPGHSLQSALLWTLPMFVVGAVLWLIAAREAQRELSQSAA